MEINFQSKRTDFVVNLATDPRDLLWHFTGPVEKSRRVVLFEISIVRADVYNAVQLIAGPLFLVFSWLRRPTRRAADDNGCGKF